MRRILFLIGLMVVPSTSHADLINYGDFDGTAVQFFNVTESSSAIGNGPGQVSELFGSPMLVGNQLQFSPNLFEANSSGPHNQLTNGQLSLTLQAKPGFAISSVSFAGMGMYSLSTPFAGTESVASSSLLGFGVSDDGMQFGSTTFSDSNANTNSSGKFGQFWSRELNFAFDDVPEVNLNLNNTLNAASTSGAASLIKSQWFTVSVNLVAIPEPGAGLLLFSLAVAGVLCQRRRRVFKP